MGIRNPLQFRLRTLLIGVTVLAAVLWAVLEYVRPFVADISFRNWSLIVFLSPAASEQLAPSNPPAGSGYHHDVYFTVSFFSLVILAIIAATGLTEMWVVFRQLLFWLARRK